MTLLLHSVQKGRALYGVGPPIAILNHRHFHKAIKAPIANIFKAFIWINISQYFLCALLLFLKKLKYKYIPFSY